MWSYVLNLRSLLDNKISHENTEQSKEYYPEKNGLYINQYFLGVCAAVLGKCLEIRQEQNRVCIGKLEFVVDHRCRQQILMHNQDYVLKYQCQQRSVEIYLCCDNMKHTHPNSQLLLELLCHPGAKDGQRGENLYPIMYFLSKRLCFKVKMTMSSLLYNVSLPL